MPRITSGLIAAIYAQVAASMRPGRNAPDNLDRVRLRRAAVPASMRPGRNAPDNLARWLEEREASSRLQ